MHPNVHPEVAGRGECLLAHVAAVGLVTAVYALVYHQVRLHGETWCKIVYDIKFTMSYRMKEA